MAFKYRVVQNKIDGSPSFNKWYGKAVNLGMVDTKTLCKEISHSTTITESDIRAIFSELAVRLNAHLIANHSVTIDGLGTFGVKLSSVATTDEKDLTASKIKNATVGFKPAINDIVRYNEKDGTTKRKFVKGLISGITFEQYSYDTAKNVVAQGKAAKATAPEGKE